jgi:hypothetical protein
VSHDKLLYKLNWYGIRGETLSWISAFLSNRSQQVVVDGESSTPSPVLSGVPQGSVLGPILFLIYINDLPEAAQSKVRLFADDTVLYRHIHTPADQQHLQDDLLRLEKWESDWSMQFHPGKCQVLHITKSPRPLLFQYTLHNTPLQPTNSAKYLGITLSSNLNWNEHICNVANKGNRTLGFLKRNLQVSSTSIKEQAYKGLVRPQLEYGATVWDPYQAKWARKIEMVQRRAARWVLHRYHNTSSVTDMLQHLNWPTLQQRRENSRLVMMYKIVHGLVAIDPNSYLTPQTRVTRGSHPFGYIQIRAKSDPYKFSYFPRTVVVWNGLPVSVACAGSLVAFRGGLLGHQAPSYPTL